MNTFRRIEGDDKDLGLVDDMVQKCREIGWDVLGRLDDDGLRKGCLGNREEREAKIWAIGHWCVVFRILGRTCDEPR